MRVSFQCKLLVLACLAIAKAHSANWATEHTLAIGAYERGDYAAAEEHDRAALADAESFDRNDLRLEATLTNLGAVLQARGACCDAERLLSRALAIRETHFGEDSIETALGKNNLAAIWLQTGRVEEARKLQTEALVTAEKVLEPNDTELIPYLTLAALTERDALHYERAEELLKRARGLAESNVAVDPRRLMQVWRHLGSVYRAAGRFEEAEQAYKSLLSLSESRFGADTLDTANALTSLGSVLCDRKFFADARPYLSRAVDIFRQIHELGVPAFIVAVQTLASTELYLGRSRSAEQHDLLVIATLKNSQRVDRDALAVAYNNLGQVYAAQGRFKEADQATIQAKDIWIAIAGPENSKVAAAISNLGAINLQEHKYKQAAALYNESAGIDLKVAGPSSLVYARDLNRLGVLYNDQKHYPEAEEVLRKALEIDSNKLGPGSPVLAEPYLNLAASLHSQRRRDEALECYRRGIEIMTNAGQRDAPNMAVVLDRYSVLLREMKRWADAEEVSTEALGIRVREKVNGETYR